MGDKITKMLYYGPRGIYKQTQAIGKLSPKEKPNPNNILILQEIQKMFSFEKYTVGVPIYTNSEWGNVRALKKRFIEVSETIIVPLLDQEQNMFIRDYYHRSQEKLKEMYGPDALREINAGRIGTNHPEMQKALKKYLESTVSIKDYQKEKRAYVFPEVWTPQETIGWKINRKQKNSTKQS